jgi:2-aminoadipate transaminase
VCVYRHGGLPKGAIEHHIRCFSANAGQGFQLLARLGHLPVVTVNQQLAGLQQVFGFAAVQANGLNEWLQTVLTQFQHGLWCVGCRKQLGSGLVDAHVSGLRRQQNRGQQLEFRTEIQFCLRVWVGLPQSFEEGCDMLFFHLNSKYRPMQFADRLNNVETSAIRELFKLLGKPGIISFAGGFPDATLFDVDGIRQATLAALDQDPGAALQYGATEGFGPLKDQLAAFMQAKGNSDVTADHLIVTTGSQQALDLIGKTMISPGDKVIVEGPTFLATIQCFRLYGADLVTAPVDGMGVDVDVLERLIVEHKPKLVYLIPTFGNPSGAMLSLDRRKRVLELAARHEVLVVEDDPYGDLYFGAPPPPSLLALSADVPGSREWLVHCGSLSKVLSPGLRVGWMIAPPELLARATMCKQFSDAHTSTFAQATAAQYLQAGRMPATLAKVRAVYAERANVMTQTLTSELGDAVQFVAPQGGLFVWARLTGSQGKLADGNRLAQRAIEHGVAFVPGSPFFATQPDAATFRLSFATVGTDRIIEGVKRLAAALG